MREKRNDVQIDWPLVAGVIVSVGAAFSAYWMNVGAAGSVVLGLLSLIIALLIDVAVRIRQSETRILESTIFESAAVELPQLITSLQTAVRDYSSACRLSQPLILEAARRALQAFSASLHELANGRLILPAGDDLTFARTGMDEVGDELRAVHYAAPVAWTTKYGERYFEANVDAIERGVKIVRIWLQPAAVLVEYRKLIETQAAAGIETLLITPDEVRPEHRHDYAIADSRLLVRMEVSREGETSCETQSVDLFEVAQALAEFDRIARVARSASQYFAAIDGCTNQKTQISA